MARRSNLNPRHDKPLALLTAALAVLLLLAACAPGARMLAAPTFTVDAANSGFVRVDPPGIGDGTASFRVALRVENPNPFAIKLAALDGDLFLQNARAAALSFRGGIDVPAGGNAPLLLDVKVPLGAAPTLLETISGLVGGTGVSYRLEASVGVELLGTVQRFPRFTLAEGAVDTRLALSAPRVSLSGSELRFESVNSVMLALDITLQNPGIVGYRVSAPELVLQVAGQEAARGSLTDVAVPAGGSSAARVSFRFDPLRLGAALVAQVQSAAAGVGGLSVALSGAWSLEAPGIAALTLQPSRLLETVVR
ncbi:MAG TPA: LEA type 2 family protein [Trueperaceae bacterium]|nr:LEA type 2 family protein [Trueperaceae bacterium]